MRSPALPRAAVFLALSVGLASATRADDPCAAFTWDVRHERTLFGREPQPVAAGKTLAASPTLVLDRLYQLQLIEQSEVALVAPPGKKPVRQAANAGLARLSVDTGGLYRIALDQALWVDAIANGAVLQAEAHQGSPGCSAPHKIVEFMLPGRTPITLQFSGGHVAAVNLTVTRSPPGT